MKQLFILRNTQGKALREEGAVVSFISKAVAKAERDVLNDDLGRIEWRVSRGKDNLKSSKPNHRATSTANKSRYSWS